MQHITKDTVVVQEVSEGEFTWDFSVQEHARLVLVFSISANKAITVIPSVHLVGRGSSAQILGIVRGTHSAKITIHTLQHHAAPETTSDLLIKSVLMNESSCFYDGSITVDPVAQKTDAYQRNENLLLDTGAKATSSPALEILANDVRCTHGAVVKTIDQNELWYCMSRGISETTARNLIANGFIMSTLDRISDSELQAKIKTQLIPEEGNLWK